MRVHSHVSFVVNFPIVQSTQNYKYGSKSRRMLLSQQVKNVMPVSVKMFLFICYIVSSSLVLIFPQASAVNFSREYAWCLLQSLHNIRDRGPILRGGKYAVAVQVQWGGQSAASLVKKYRVIHKSLRNFRTRLRNNQDRHSRKEHIEHL
jgi:hypothetical protein